MDLLAEPGVPARAALRWVAGATRLALLLALGGCASGSGSTTTPPPVAPPPPDCIPTHGGNCLPAPEFQSAAEDLAEEYRQDSGFQNQWGLDLVGAGRAYGHVNLLEGPDAAPGAGVTIGVIDSGIAAGHPIFAGKTIHRGFLFGAEPETGEMFSHGTAVASIAAGAKTEDPNAPHGIAWGANLAVWAIPLGEADQVYEPIPLATLARADPGFTYMFEQVFAWRDEGNDLDILNLSFGYDGLITGYSEEDLRANFGATIATLAQADASEKTILLWAAGNANNDACEAGVANCVNGVVDADSVGVLPGLVARIEELQGHSVAVVALGPDGGAITDFSNRCGIAAEFCIAAPGEDVALAYFGPRGSELGVQGYSRGKGTSYATPMVAGGLAIMKQLFRDQLSNEELVTRLFATADTTGIYADREVYGQGRMDLGAATSPVGVLEVPLATGTALAAHASLGSTGLRLGAAFGDGLAAGFDGDEIMALDGYGAPFWYDIGDFAATTDGPSMSARLRTFLGPGSGGLSAGGGSGGLPTATGTTAGIVRMPTAAGNGHLALAEGAARVGAYEAGGLSAAAFTTGPLRPAMPATGAALAWRPGSLPVGFSAGWISERETMLGTLGTGAFGSLSAETAFFGFNGGVEFGGWDLEAHGELGVVNPAASGGLIREITPLATSTFAVHASRGFARAGLFSFSLSQPLRVENGWASLTAPAARTKAGEVVYRSLRAELAPGERQLDFAAQWNRALPLGELRLGAVWSHWTGHRRMLGTQLAALAGWRWAF
ncbi:MAG: S8 family serine peptidase [Acidobacteriota bacterium]|nr:S8 family serine peptidase [Acidobacteriota bacterium]